MLTKGQYIAALEKSLYTLRKERYDGKNPSNSEIPCVISWLEKDIKCLMENDKVRDMTTLPKLVTDKVVEYLPLNDILRFRRVCHWAKDISDEYLRLHKPSEEVITIDPRKEEEFEKFLQDNREIGINKPVSQAYINLEYDTGKIFEDWKFKEFASTYGKQITCLDIYDITIPMKYVAEIEFYEQFPNLTCLKVHTFVYDEDEPSEEHEGPDYEEERKKGDFEENKDAGKENVPKIRICDGKRLPESFKNITNLKFRTRDCLASWSDDSSLVFGKLIEHCSNLERISCPVSRDDYEHNTDDHLRQLKLMKNIFDNGSNKKLRTLDFQGFIRCGHGLKPNPEFAPLMLEIATKPDIKCLHIDSIYFCKFTVDQIRLLAPQVFSIDITYYTNANYFNVEFPNVRKMRIREGYADEGFTPESFKNTLSPKMFPSLKKLFYEEAIWNTDRIGAMLWTTFPDLEEVKIYNFFPKLEDPTFLGVNPLQPAFLHLSKLRKLTLHITGVSTIMTTDRVFQDVFRHLGLREFRIYAASPMKNVSIEGIRSLKTGRFNETIEVFPFSSWKLEGVGDTEFLQLAREFPCNRLLAIM